jgi:cobaltochelatase CobT subunit
MSSDDMKGDMFQHELSKTSSVFGRKKDIRVVFQGEDAKTNGSTIVLPSLVQNEDVGMESQLIMRGYVDHEAGHVKHTNHTAVKKLHAEGDEMVCHLANAIEDVWLERKVIDEYEGAKKNLSAVSQAVSQGCLDSHEKDDELWKQDKNVAPVAITWVGRQGYGGEAAEKCLERISPDLKKAIEGWVTAIDASKGTADNIAIARVIANELRDESYKDDERKGDGDGEDEHTDDEHGGGGGDDGIGGGIGGGSGDESDGEAKGKGDGDGEASSPRGSREVDGEAREMMEEEFKPMEADMSKAMQERLRVDGLTTDGGERYKALSTAHDKFHHRSDENGKYRFNGGQHLRMGDAHDYDCLVHDTAGYINVMRRKLERAILSRANRDWETGKESGRLDSKRLVGAVAGRKDIFKDRLSMPEMDTALSVLIDLSGSMYDEPACVARDCAIAIVESLDRTGVAYEILGFNSRSSQEAKLAPKVGHDGGRLWSRFEPIDIWEFKRFKERLFEAKGSLSQIDSCVGGNNVDGESVMYAYDRLRKRPEKRKILMVLSDGQPAAHSYCSAHLKNHLRKTVKDIGDSGVDCIGVGILSDAVRFYYPTYVVVDSLEDLATNVMDQLAKALMGGRFHVNNADLLDVG